MTSTTHDYAADRAIRQQQLQAIGQALFSDKLTTLFSELTGWDFTIHWEPPLAWDAALPFGATAFCTATCDDTEAAAECSSFEKGCLDTVLVDRERGFAFTCPLGVHSYWQAVMVEGFPLAIIVVQFPKDTRKHHARRPRRAVLDGMSPMSHASRRHFDHAKALTQVLVDELRQSILARARLQDIHKLSRSVVAHQHVETRLRKDLRAKLPFVAETSLDGSENEDHREKMIHTLIDYIHSNYAGPLSLQNIADEKGMNMAHLSTLFSRTVGMPFRSYVKALRLEKAQELLCDSTRRVSEVAYEVGYSDPNRFRLDFKERTGLSPTAWRNILR